VHIIRHCVRTLAFSPDGRYALTGSADNTAKLWSVPDGAYVKNLGEYSYAVTSIAFSPDGLYLLTGSVDGTALLWEAKK
jgi:WD40 repeat protein